MGSFNWKKIGGAQIFGRGRYLKDGEYKLTILKTYTIETRDKGPAFIVDFTVNESDNPEILVDQKRNWYQALKDKDIAFPAIKEFMLALFGIDMADKEQLEEFEAGLDEMMEAIADEEWKDKPDEDHPLFGKTVGVSCFTKETRKNKEPFTVHTWEPWDGEAS
jgi:hypothetical protein